MVFSAKREACADQGQIFTKLDFYVTCIRQDYPNIDELSPRNKATLVARYLKARGWTGMRDGRDYYNVEHNFLGVALYGEGHNSLPLITVVIYCYVARALGLRAAPCSFPMHVHALVRPPRGYGLEGDPLDADGEDSAMYMDPFRSDEEVPLSSLIGQLRLVSHQFIEAEVESFLLESDARDITFRCARNIFNSQRSTEAPLEDVDKYNAMYGAAWASVLVPKRIGLHPPQHVALLMQAFLENSTYDVGLIEKYILPLYVGIPDYTRYVNECRVVRRNDEMKRPGRGRSGKNAAVKYKVGQVFQHKRYGYIAAITGWDPECSSSELWIRQMGVDRLPKGRQQPFYHVL
jgi:F-box protein 21